MPPPVYATSVIIAIQVTLKTMEHMINLGEAMFF